MPFDDPFLGSGWSFPPTFDKDTGGVEMTSGVADIQKSLEILFTTSLGERIMNPAFGCSLADMVFEPMNTSMLTYIQNLLQTAILYHEPRIDADEIVVEPHDGFLLIKLGYTVRSTNSRFNFVFPYYVNPIPE